MQNAIVIISLLFYVLRKDAAVYPTHTHPEACDASNCGSLMSCVK